MNRIVKNKIGFGLFGIFLLSFIFINIIQYGWFSSIHLKFSNFLYNNSENQASEDIIIVAIDDKSFSISNASELGVLKFEKADYAKVINNLENNGVKSVGVDVIFSEISPKEDRLVLVDTLRSSNNIILATEPKTENTTGLSPRSEFIEANPGNLGSILFSPDEDNTIRRQKVIFNNDKQLYSFAVQIVKKYLNLR